MIHEAELGLVQHEEVYRGLQDRLVGVAWEREDYRHMFGTGYVRDFRYANPRSMHAPQVYEEYLTYVRFGKIVAAFHNYAVSFSELGDTGVENVMVYGIYTDTNNIELMRSDASGNTVLELVPEFAAWASLSERLGV